MQQWFGEAAVGYDAFQAFLLAVTDTVILQGTTTGDKNEILWQHGVNYHNLSEQFKKASCRLAKSNNWSPYSAPCDCTYAYHPCPGAVLSE